MAYQLWAQDNFSKGELTPFLYGRCTLSQYYDGLKQAKNVLTYPTGAAGKRFGTLYQATLSGITSFDQIFFQTFQYLDECIYQLVFSPLNIAIYLEGILQANVVTPFDAHATYNLSSTVIEATFRVAGAELTPTSNRPYDLTRSAAVGITITGVSGGQFSVGVGLLPPSTIRPVQFTLTAPIVTVPQIKKGITYFIRTDATGTFFSVYSTASDAKFNTNPYVITSSAAVGNTVSILNTWSFVPTTFRNLPPFDFNGGYDAITFTIAPLSGNAVIITASAPIFTPAHVGGIFTATGGTGKITVFTSTTVITVATVTPFSYSPVTGSLVFLAEPAWSDARGWPQKCSSYQNRALFANTVSLPNGFWASVVNEYDNFGDLTPDDDDAISWYPTSNETNFIRFIVPFRSLTVHTNTGIYSTPLSEIAAITPNTFTLQLQDSTPADVLQPQSIDNQIIVVSGDDVHTMVWDGINNAYTSSIVSITSEHLIRNPMDETSFADLRRAGSRYVFFVNENGTLAVYQTLVSELVTGFTPQTLEQSYGHAKFLQVASSFDGRCWFVNQREIATVLPAVNVTDFTEDTLTAIGSNFSTTDPTPVIFTTVGSLPTSRPQIELNTYYWAFGLTADTFTVHLTQQDAKDNSENIKFFDAGSGTQVVPSTLSTIFTLEELSQDVKLDCAVYYNSTATSTVSTGSLFNAQSVKMIGSTENDALDGFGFDAVGVNDQVTFESHGEPVEIKTAYIGFPIHLLIEPMPIAVPAGQQSSLTKPTHIRSVRFMFNNTIGGTINGVPIALEPFNEAHIGEPPFPSRGVFEMSIMSGWDDFNHPSFTIEHSDPFNIELIGVFYSVDV